MDWIECEMWVCGPWTVVNDLGYSLMWEGMHIRQFTSLDRLTKVVGLCVEDFETKLMLRSRKTDLVIVQDDYSYILFYEGQELDKFDSVEDAKKLVQEIERIVLA